MRAIESLIRFAVALVGAGLLGWAAHVAGR
jgi:hypothetical protein